MEREGRGNLRLSEVKRKKVMAMRRVVRSITTTCCTEIAIEEDGSLERETSNETVSQVRRS